MWYICIKDVIMEDDGEPTGEIAFIKDKVYDWKQINRNSDYFVAKDELYDSDHRWPDIHNDALFKKYFKRYRKPRIRKVNSKEFNIGKYL